MGGGGHAGASVAKVHAWLRDTTYDALPDAVQSMATRCLLDLAGTAAAGSETPLARLAGEHAVSHFAAAPAGPRARLLFDGRTASPTGAALAGGMTIDSIDAHDGHVLTKGHAGAAVLPGLLALVDAADTSVSGAELLTLLVAGYEIALRAGITLHESAADYHTSGAWNALGVAAVASRLWGLDEPRFRHALGIAEYHGPRSQMMRCIDHPTMLKDGSGWGAMCGVSAAYLAAAGFSGAPAILVEAEAAEECWSDIGRRWRILELYFKLYPVCRWAQPAIEAALRLRASHRVDPDAVAEVEVETFHEATRLGRREPATPEEAQYSLPFPVAVALVRGRLAPGDLEGGSLQDEGVLALSRRVRLVEDPGLSARFPAERLARVSLRLRDGSTLRSDTVPARGDAGEPLPDSAISAKFHELAGRPLGRRAGELEDRIASLPAQSQSAALLDALLGPPAGGGEPGRG